MSNEIVFYQRTFVEKLNDAIELLRLAYITKPIFKDQEEVGALVRASLIHSTLLMETAANCLISTLNLQQKFFEVIDRATTEFKLEYFLREKDRDRKFDRGCIEYQRVRELIQLRNAYVHPKIEKVKLKRVDGEWSYTPKYASALGIPHCASDWTADHARKALKAATAFLNVYFLKWCQMQGHQVFDLLAGFDKVPKPRDGRMTIILFSEFEDVLKDWKIDLRFLGQHSLNK